MCESLHKNFCKWYSITQNLSAILNRPVENIPKYSRKPENGKSLPMKRLLTFLPILVGLSFQFLLLAPAAAETPRYPLSFNWTVTQASKYLFQGIDYSNGNPVAQPQIGFGYKNVSFTSWFNYDQEEHQFDEIDLYLQSSWAIEKLSLAPGYAYFNYPNREGWEPSQELYIDISYDTFLSPTFSPHYDVDRGQGAYLTFGLGHELETSLGSFGLGAKIFYQSNYYEVTGFPSAQFSGKYSYSKGSFSISPSISHFLTWNNGDFRDDSRVPETWLFSLDIAQSF